MPGGVLACVLYGTEGGGHAEDDDGGGSGGTRATREVHRFFF